MQIGTREPSATPGSDAAGITTGGTALPLGVTGRRRSVAAVGCPRYWADERSYVIVSVEIEVKYRVVDGQKLQAALATHGIELSPPVHQDDQAYAPHTWTPDSSRIGVTFVRLRSQNGRHTFTTKTPVDNVLACREHETIVEDREQMHDAILAMGYRPTVRVVKQRRTARVSGYSLCVDDVEGVGAFLEVEAVAEHTDDMVRVQDDLAIWVDRLGAPLQRTAATYDQLVQNAPAPA